MYMENLASQKLPLFELFGDAERFSVGVLEAASLVAVEANFEKVMKTVIKGGTEGELVVGKIGFVIPRVIRSDGPFHVHVKFPVFSAVECDGNGIRGRDVGRMGIDGPMLQYGVNDMLVGWGIWNFLRQANSFGLVIIRTPFETIAFSVSNR